MDKALLDTDIFSEVLKGIDHTVTAKATTYRSPIQSLGYKLCLDNWRFT